MKNYITKKILEIINVNEEKITVYVSLHQFDTNNHGWKVFAIEDSINK